MSGWVQNDDGTWYQWAVDHGTTSTTAVTWNVWCDAYSGTTASSDSSTVWVKWSGKVQYNTVAAPRELTPEEKAEHKRQDDVRKAEVKEAERVRLAALERSKALLFSALSTEQVQAFNEKKAFRVRSERGHEYEIDCTKSQHNVFRLGPDGKRVEELCALVPGVPLHDTHAAQKLALETDEDGFRRVANRWDLSNGRRTLVRV